MRRALAASAAAGAVSRADSLPMEAPAVHTAAGMPAVDTAAVEVTVAGDTAAGAKRSVVFVTVLADSEAPLSRAGFLFSDNLSGGRFYLGCGLT